MKKITTLIVISEVVQKNGTLFCIKNAENGSKENQEITRTLWAWFQRLGVPEVILRMRIAAQLNSGKNVDEISKTFGIGRNVLYTWKSKSQMKTKTKTSEEQTTYSLRIISENELLKKENARLQSERDILKKVSAGVPVVLFSTSS